MSKMHVLVINTTHLSFRFEFQKYIDIGCQNIEWADVLLVGAMARHIEYDSDCNPMSNIAYKNALRLDVTTYPHQLKP
jgi:hypothetical protein